MSAPGYPTPAAAPASPARPWRRWWPWAICLGIGLLVAAATVGIREFGWLQTPELKVYDAYLRTRPPTPATAPVALIGETEADLRRFGHPLSDQILADALTRIIDAGAQVVGVDKFRETPVAPGTEALSDLLRRNSSVVWIEQFGDRHASPIGPPAALADSDQVGFADLVEDSDGLVRRGLLFLDDGQRFAYSLGLRMALAYLAPRGLRPAPDPERPEHLRLGQVTLPPLEHDDGPYVDMDAAGYQFMLDFRGMPHPFPCFTLGELMDGRVPPAALRDRVVILGSVAESLLDRFHTPFGSPQTSTVASSCFSSTTKRRTYGLEIHGLVTAQLIRSALEGAHPLRTWSEAQERAWIFLWALLAAVQGFWAPSLARFVLYNSLGLTVLIGGTLLALWGHHWIPVVPPALAWLGTAVLVSAFMHSREKAQRSLLMQLFSRHVSTDVAREIWLHRDEFVRDGRPHPQRLTATALFADIQGFTAIADELAPETLMEWLNTYMSEMAQVIEDHQGIIKQYAGDAIMAVFGVPVPRRTEEEIDTDAVHAVRCALAMGAALERLNRRWEADGLPIIASRMGIHTGLMVAGSIGSSRRQEYNLFGDSVIIAARLESFDKRYLDPKAGSNACRVYIGESTLNRLGGRFETHFIGEVELKGIHEKVRVHCVTKERPVPELET